MFTCLMFLQVISQENENAEMRTNMMKWLLVFGETHTGCHKW